MVKQTDYSSENKKICSKYWLIKTHKHEYNNT